MTPTPTLDLSTIHPDPAQAARIPRTLATRRLLLPLAQINGTLHIACTATPPPPTLALLQKYAAPSPLAFHLVPPPQLRRALLRLYGPTPTPTTPPPENDPVALADELFRAARLRHASDIHLDPSPQHLRVRFRVDGFLEEYRPLPPTTAAPLISRIKVLANMDIAERRAPQDGAFTLPPLPDDPQTATDVRVATLPTRHGERLTLRLLTSDRQRLTLENLGMSPHHLAIVEDLLSRPHGLFLLTGPTGSGKSTTLYAAIRRLLQLGNPNILTVEDPIEYEIPGVAQAEIDTADKVSFQKALRSLLRHDPDVIMIGEIRDPASLDTAVKAALTGHLVLSTLHTNSAPGAITRLANMGLAPHLIAAVLRLAIAQRLVRRLCPHCRRPRPLTPAEATILGNPSLAGRTAYDPGACLHCAGRGYYGRTAIFELLRPDAPLNALIVQGASLPLISHHLANTPHQTLAHDAAAKILSGLISPTDALREL